MMALQFGQLNKELRGWDKKGRRSKRISYYFESSKMYALDLRACLFLTALSARECITRQSHVSNMSLKGLLLLAVK